MALTILVHSIYLQYLKSTRVGADERGVGVDLQVVGIRLRLVSFVAAASEPDTIIQMSDVIQSYALCTGWLTHSNWKWRTGWK